MAAETHYVGHIRIERVVKEDKGPMQPDKRQVTETTNLVIKASTLPKLINKIAAHTSLLDDEDV